MRNILLILIAGVALTSCNMFSSKKHDGYRIRATVENAPPMQIFLEEYQEKGLNIIDTAQIKDGTFELEGLVSGQNIYRLRFGSAPSMSKIILLVLDNNSDVELKINWDDFDKYVVEGSSETAILKQFMDDRASVDKKITGMEQQYKGQSGAVPLDSMQRTVESNIYQMIDDYEKRTRQRIDTIKSPFTAIVAADNFVNPEEHDFLKKISAKHADALKDNKYYQSFSNRLNARSSTSVGSLAPDIMLQDANGEMRYLSALRGKVVLLDFWASWCGPCRRTNPELVATYNQFKDKGFTIYSVSLDNNKQAWLAAIQQDGLAWESHVSDLRGWQSSVNVMYNVQSIPQTFLLDKEGKIRAKNIHGANLRTELTRLLGEPAPPAETAE